MQLVYILRASCITHKIFACRIRPWRVWTETWRLPAVSMLREGEYMDNSSFQQLEASSLYCPRCKVAVPVRKRLLIILPEGEKFEYLCTRCAETLGTKIEPISKDINVLVWSICILPWQTLTCSQTQRNSIFSCHGCASCLPADGRFKKDLTLLPWYYLILCE